MLPQWVPVSSLRQRAGRAGRTSPGKCWHLVTKARAATLPPSQAPEMLRTPLSEICLSASLLCGTYQQSVEEFLLQAPSPPSERAITHALDVLNKVGAMDGANEITEFGRLLSRLSLDPRLAKMVLVSCCLGCLSPILIVAGAADNRDPFMLPMNPAKKAQARDRHTALGKGELGWAQLLLRVYVHSCTVWSVHPCPSLLTVCKSWVLMTTLFNFGDSRYNRWLLAPDKRRFAEENYIRPEALRMIQSITSQVEGQLRSLRLVGPDSRTHLFSMDEANRNAADLDLVNCCLAGGLYPNVAVPIPNTKRALETASGVRVVAQSLPPSDRWVVYEKAARASGRLISLHNATPVPALAVLCFSGQFLVGSAPKQPDPIEDDQVSHHCGSSRARISPSTNPGLRACPISGG